MSLTDLQRDILIKSAEGIQEGMWCIGDWFANSPNVDTEDYECVTPDEVFEGEELLLNKAQVEALTGMYRCAEGELMLRTIVLGGKLSDYYAVEKAVHGAILERCQVCAAVTDIGALTIDVFDHNDTCMGTLDPFTAGQQWSDIFRSLL